MTAWTAGQWVEGQDALPAYWDGSSWQDGRAPALPITATDVTAGTPGEWLPTGAETPSLVQASGITPSNPAGWAEGEWVPTTSTAPNNEIHWSSDGTNHWASGKAPAVVVPPIGKATGATAGTPGTFTPPGADLPASESDIVALTPDPATGWQTGEYIVDANGIEYYFDGAEWYVGRAP